MITVTANGVDITKEIQMNSLKIENILTNQRDKCSFSMLTTSNVYAVQVGQELIVTLDGDRVFGGIIAEVELESDSIGSVRWIITADDYTRLLDKRLIPESYENQTVNEIIADMQARYMPSGITIANVDCALVIKYVAFNYKPISACIEDLARMVGYDWYIDADKDIHFFPPSTNLAPFDVNDDDGSYRYDSLILRLDNTQVRNSIVVRGGTYLGTQFTSEIEANGTDAVYPLAYKYTDFSCTLTGNPLNIGIDYIDNPDNYDALYNFNEKIIRFKDGDKPSNGAIMRIGGKPNLPVIIKLKSNSAIATMSAQEGSDGIYEYLIVDKNINTKEGARQRARAEIATYADTLTEGEFVTEMAGLRAGMKIRVNSVSRDVDTNLVINRVTLTQWTKDSFVYKVSLISTKSYDFIDMMKTLLLAKTKEVDIQENETIDQIFTFEESLYFADELGTFSTHGTTYRYSPSSLDGLFNFATWS